MAKAKLVRIAIGGDRALSNSRTAINIYVSDEERNFLDRLAFLFHLSGKEGSFENLGTTLHVLDMEG